METKGGEGEDSSATGGSMEGLGEAPSPCPPGNAVGGCTDPNNPGRPRRGQWADGWGRRKGRSESLPGPRESMTHTQLVAPGGSFQGNSGVCHCEPGLKGCEGSADRRVPWPLSP